MLCTVARKSPAISRTVQGMTYYYSIIALYSTAIHRGRLDRSPRCVNKNDPDHPHTAKQNQSQNNNKTKHNKKNTSSHCQAKGDRTASLRRSSVDIPTQLQITLQVSGMILRCTENWRLRWHRLLKPVAAGQTPARPLPSSPS